MVSAEVDGPARNENFRRNGGEVVVDQAMFAVFALRPGVRKINMERMDGGKWQEVFHKIGRFQANASQVGQLGAQAFPAQLPNSAEERFTSDEIMSRILSGPFYQKRATPAPQFHFQRLACGKKLQQIQRLHIRRG